MENKKKASNFTFFNTMTPTSARVTEAKAASKMKYVPRVIPVPKYSEVIDHQTPERSPATLGVKPPKNTPPYIGSPMKPRIVGANAVLKPINAIKKSADPLI